MLTELLNRVHELGRLQRGVTPIELIGDELQAERMLVQTPEGQLRSVRLRPPGHNVCALTLEAVGELAQAASGEPVIYVGAEVVTLILDREAMDTGVVLFRLPITAAWQFIRAAIGINGAVWGQDELAQFARYHVSGVTPGDFADTISDLRFSTAREGVARIRHGKESIGTDVHREVSGGVQPVPKEVSFTLPRVVGQEEYKLQFAVTPVWDKASFRLTPIRDSIRVAELQSLNDMRHRLSEIAGDEVPVYAGHVNGEEVLDGPKGPKYWSEA